jgi:hypothetical protein
MERHRPPRQRRRDPRLSRSGFKDGNPALITAPLSDVAKARGSADPPKPRLDIALDSVIQKLKDLDLELTAKAE